jgi:hypothetical protein
MAKSLSKVPGLHAVRRVRRNPFRNVAPAAVAGIIVSVNVISILSSRR